MAFSEFFVTKGAGAADTNGGGPRMGANDAPIYSSTNSTVSGGTPTTIVDGSGGNWAGVQVGDWLLWDTAGVKEHRRVTVVAPGGDATKITVHAACTAGATKTTKVGGAWATWNGALALIRNTAVDASGNPPCVNIQGGSAYTGDAATAAAGDTTTPIFVEGYTTDPHDGGEAELDARLNHAYAFWSWRNLYINRAAAGGSADAIVVSADKNRFENVRARASAGQIAFNITGWANFLVGCQALGGATGFAVGGGNNRLTGCRANAVTATGFLLSSQAAVLKSIAHGCNGAGFLTNSYAHAEQCTSYGNGGAGFEFTTGIGTEPLILACIAFGNTGAGLKNNTANGWCFEDYNALGSNTGGARSGIAAWCQGPHDVTLSGDPFVNAAAGDFRIDPRKAAGRQLLQAGFPASLNGQLARYDIGALQAALAANLRG